MYIPMWLILFVVFLFNPDIAFILAIIYCCIHSPITAMILLGIYLLFVLFFKSCDFWDEKVKPFLEENKTINKIKPYLKKIPDLLYYFFLFIIFGFSLFMILYAMIY